MQLLLSPLEEVPNESLLGLGFGGTGGGGALVRCKWLSYFGGLGGVDIFFDSLI